MPPGPTQNYANHRTNDTALIGIGVLALLSALSTFSAVFGFAHFAALASLFMAGALIWTVIRMRAYATRLQDRIIRLEMQLRLARVLPSDLAARVDELELTHLIGLRFASDRELPELMRKVLANKSMRSNDIKKLVAEWQADHLRV